MASGKALSCTFNVGGCFFSVPLSRLSCFQESLLFKAATDSDRGSRMFIDRDGCTFRHLHYYIHTGKLSTSCAAEVSILYELATGLHLTSLQQALENLQSGKHFLRARPVDLQVTERASLNYWKTRICNTKQETMASPVCSAHDAVPLGLVGTPLVDSDEEVLYCFLPLEQIRLHPNLITKDNLLWLCESVAVIECRSRLFRFLANFLLTGKIVLPEQFSDHENLCAEAKIVGMTEFINALQEMSDVNGDSTSELPESSPIVPLNSSAQPLYVMTFDLLVRYPDSALGQLWIDSNLEGSKLYITGTGVIFQHVENWLGTCRLPLTASAAEMHGLCEYLYEQDDVYLAMKEALHEYLSRKQCGGGSFTAWPWSASVATFTVYKVIKVYVGTHWYATYLKTLLKHSELLSNTSKTSWISFGESLHVKADGQIFRHILNFLRSGRLMLPAEFTEWPLLCQEIKAFQIPALSGALEDCREYRAWCKTKHPASDHSSSSSLDDSVLVYDEDPFLECSLESKEHGEQTFLTESPDNAVISSGRETSSGLSDEEAACTSVDVSSEAEERPAAEAGRISQSRPLSSGQTNIIPAGDSTSLPSAQTQTTTCSGQPPTSDSQSALDHTGAQEPPAFSLTGGARDGRGFCSPLRSALQQASSVGVDGLDMLRWLWLRWTEMNSGQMSPRDRLALLVEGTLGGQMEKINQALMDFSDEERAVVIAVLLKAVSFCMKKRADVIHHSKDDKREEQTQPPQRTDTKLESQTQTLGTHVKVQEDMQVYKEAMKQGECPWSQSIGLKLETQTQAPCAAGTQDKRAQTASIGLKQRECRETHSPCIKLKEHVQKCKEKSHGVKPYSKPLTEAGEKSWSKVSFRACGMSVQSYVIKVDHPPVLGKGEAGGYFTHSVIYTDFQLYSSLSLTLETFPHWLVENNFILCVCVCVCVCKPSDVAFAYFNLSYDEMVHARECHVFLTGLILDSKQLDPEDRSLLKTANLVHFLWTGQTGAEDFVMELMSVIHVKGRRRDKEKEHLLQWLKLTLPLAKRFSECMEVFMKGPCQTHTLFPEEKPEDNI
ncbi:BTB/POZ domain-containing protein KCTD19-like [Chanos chanos]|uniref:BTB/POZ domain-containing protein KCTD19-like n=1 Tax=Chanos chanos TaxID=29144 RepID=A0A6J2X074_CHACN|nr:BTB/POZ domain-containing protein KCTD19 [Chanos chanos]